MRRRWLVVAVPLLVLLAAATGGQGNAAAGRCGKALPRGPAGVPAAIVVTTRCGRYRLEPGGTVAFVDRRTSPVPREAEAYWPDLVWYGFVRHHLLIGRGLRQLWRSHERYPARYAASVGRIALGRAGLSFSYFRQVGREPRLYFARYERRERVVGRGEDPLGFLASGALVTWRHRHRALVLRGRDGRFERVVSVHAVEPQFDPGARLVVFRTGRVRHLRVFDGARIRELAELQRLGVEGVPVVEPLGRLVAVHDLRRILVLDYGGRLAASAPLPERRAGADGVSSSVVASADARAVAFTATRRSRGAESVYLLTAGARRARVLFTAHVDFKGCGWSSSVAWHEQWLLYDNGDRHVVVVDGTGATGAVDLSDVVARLPGFERDGLFDIAWASAP